MKPLITIDRLRIYQSYGGDIDEIMRRNRKQELDKCEGDLDRIWTTIDDSVQNIELIEKGLTSLEFKNGALSKLK
jgi:hypothetical protein